MSRQRPTPDEMRLAFLGVELPVRSWGVNVAAELIVATES